MLTFNQLQTILVYLSEKLHTTDNGLVQKFIKENSHKLDTFHYVDSNESAIEYLHYTFKPVCDINLHSLTGKTFDILEIKLFLDIILEDAENVINAARDEQIKPYLTRIDNL